MQTAPNPRPRQQRIPVALFAGLVCACATIEPMPSDPYQIQESAALPVAARGAPGAPREVGHEIVICGRRFGIGAPVVLWTDPGGYDAYQGASTGERSYRPGRRAQPELGRGAVDPSSDDVGQLARAVDQFVLHYDVCGLSRTCFEVLHERDLSVHFLLDIDGTLYQTMDLRDTAWHATKANARSIGVEIAQIGARMPAEVGELDPWYVRDGGGVTIEVPARLGDGGVRTQGFRGRPASPELIEGRINGTRLLQYDFTPQQYETLAALAATLTRVLPQIRPRVPRDARGEVVDGVLSKAAFQSFSGILGHYHVQANKTDPGPAFDWDGLLRRIR